MNIVITAGGTSEAIDGVRTITNMSTGKLGATICNTFLENAPINDKINVIYYICTKKSVKPNDNSKIVYIYIEGVRDLEAEVKNLLAQVPIDWFIHSMAVSDYYVDYLANIDSLASEIEKYFIDRLSRRIPESICNTITRTLKYPENTIDNETKVSSDNDDMIIKLTKAPKVISIIKEIQPTIRLIGFKLLNNVSENELVDVAYDLLLKNDCEYVIANDIKEIRKGTHTALLIDENKNIRYMRDKEDIAFQLARILFNS